MKRAGPDHPKVRRLKRRLNVGLAYVVGILELLFHWVAKYAPSGDVGRFEDEDLEDACAWEGADGALIAALRAERFLDDHPLHRLVVHGWSEHADDAVHAQLARAGRLFADGTKPKVSRLTASERARCEPLLEQAQRQLMGVAQHAHAEHADADQARGERTADADHGDDERMSSARRTGSPAPPFPAPPVEDSALFANAQSADCSNNNETADTNAASSAASFVAAYHELCPQLPRCREITIERQKKINTRMREHDLRWWRDVFSKLKESPFLRGESTNGWRPDLDWLIKNPNNALRVLEGSYDRQTSNSTAVRHQRFANHDELFRKEPASGGGDS